MQSPLPLHLHRHTHMCALENWMHYYIQSKLRPHHHRCSWFPISLRTESYELAQMLCYLPVTWFPPIQTPISNTTISLQQHFQMAFKPKKGLCVHTKNFVTAADFLHYCNSMQQGLHHESMIFNLGPNMLFFNGPATAVEPYLSITFFLI